MSRCRTDTDTIHAQHDTLHQTHQLFNHTNTKIVQVIEATGAVNRQEKRTLDHYAAYLNYLILSYLTYLSCCSKGSRTASRTSRTGDLISCSVFISYVESVISSGSSVVSR